MRPPQGFVVFAAVLVALGTGADPALAAGTLPTPGAGPTSGDVVAQPSLTAPFQSGAVGHSSAGTLFASSTDFVYESRLDLVRDDGSVAWTRTLPASPPPDGASTPRNLQLCGDTLVSTRYTYDQTTGRTAGSVQWSSLTTSAHGSADAGYDPVVSAAPNGWVTATSTTADSGSVSTTLVLHTTAGTTRSLGTVTGTASGQGVCDGASLVLAASDWGVDRRLVRYPFDGSGPVVVDQRPATQDTWEDLTPLGVSGTEVLWTRTPTSYWTPGPGEVWRTSPTGPVLLATAPSTDRLVQGGAIGAAGALLCWPKADLSQGCDATLYPASGSPQHVETPQSRWFWPTASGFVEGCDGNFGGCEGLYALSLPGLTVRQLWKPRMPIGIVRWSGPNRYATAADIIMHNYGPLTSSDGFLASGESFPDVLGAGAMAARWQVPLFLTTRGRLPQEMVQPLQVMRRYRIFVIGGTGAVSDAVLAQVRKYAQVVVRIDGSDRYATAAAVSRTFNDPGTKTAYVVSGENYPDGLVAAPSAAQEYAPVLLTAAASLPASTRAELVRLKPQRVVVVGGPGVVSTHVLDELRGIVGSGGSVLRLAGASRYDTAVAVSRRLWADGAGSVALASGANFPDALALGPATRGYLPLLLTAPDHLPASTRAEVQRLRPSSVLIAGGTAVVGAAIEGELRAIPDLP